MKPTSDKMLPFRQQVSQTALTVFRGNMAAKHVPVELRLTFYFEQPPSAKKREYPSVAPDVDKLERCILDALKGIAYADDAQVVHCDAWKRYGSPARTEITVSEL